MTCALSITNLSKTYKNGVEALKGVDLYVEQGDFFALLGPNGAGKSTTIGIVSSLVNIGGGTVEVFGHDIVTEKDAAKSCIGLVPQEFNFNQFELVGEIVINQAGYYGIPYKLAAERAERYLKKLGLWDKRKSQARDLSGGMKRRLLIARALVHEPKLLILDEPTAGVDIEIRRQMWDFMREVNEQGTTIILTTHYLEEAEQLCRNIAIINDGCTIESTAMKTLLASLHEETFILDLHQPLLHVPDIAGYRFQQIDDTTLTVSVSKDQNLNKIFTELEKHNVCVSSMRNKSNRLEELFMR
ncbi:MAG: ABC transporter ATP-binding protein, partial [Gammaproteobacteria bacterium]|nr:ABC transporter ATP-binding protein [Gammaproteobacteria bacterium]